MADDIRRWSEELARDPSSLVFLPLGEALRRQGQLDMALRIAVRGLERHSHNAEAHDLLARIEVARGELQHAFDEWDMVLRLAPNHLGALKGMAYVCFQQGRAADAERYLEQAAAAGGDDEVAAALANVRRARPGASGARRPASPMAAPAEPEPHAPERAPAGGAPTARVPGYTPNDPHALFADLLGEHEQTALLLDDQGLVLAGMYLQDDGTDVAAEVGAELSGVTDVARRATKHLAIGDWRSIALETEVAVVTMAPAGEALLVLAASKSTPLGLVRRVLDRCVERSRSWLGVGK